MEVGGFYNYDGVWTSLSNQISAWITDYTANLTYNYDFMDAYTDKKTLNNNDGYHAFDIKLPYKNVNKLKHVKFDSGDIMLVYEIWNQTDYQYTAYQVVDMFAAPLVSETRICYPIRLHRTESIYLDKRGNVKILEARDGNINIYTISESENPTKFEDDGAILTKVSLLLATLIIVLI